MDLFEQLENSKEEGNRGMFFYKNDPSYPTKEQREELTKMGYLVVDTDSPRLVEVQDESEFDPYCTVYFYPKNKKDKKRYNL